jgi:hypothetical protein
VCASDDVPDRATQPQPQRFGVTDRGFERVVVVEGDDLVGFRRWADLDQHVLILRVERQRALELRRRQDAPTNVLLISVVHWSSVVEARYIVPVRSLVVSDRRAEVLQRLGALVRQDHAAIAAVRQPVEPRAQRGGRCQAGAPERARGILAQRLGEGLLAPGVRAREAGHQPARQPRVAEELQQRLGLELGAASPDHALVVGDSVADRGGVAVVADLVWVEQPLAVGRARRLLEISDFE